MSLGFLTESALLPSKAKAIKVDSKSLVDLRAVVFQKEQERQERKRSLCDALLGDDNNDRSSKASTAGTRGFGRFAHLKAAKKRGDGSDVLPREEEKIGKKTNRGVEKRRKEDEAALEEQLNEHDDDRAWHKKSRDMLAKKAKLYDAMMNGRAPASGNSSAAVTECLVDFRAKKKFAMDSSAAPKSNEIVEITDEFGRARMVAKDSAEYAEFLQQQIRKAAGSVLPTISSEHEADPRTESQSANGSFVVSQWEKRLNSQERTYLQEVHEGVTHAKSAHLNKKTRKQLRLEKLRQQTDASSGPAAREESKVSSFEFAANAQEEHAASVKATEFLNQLGSLM